jgi:hypothetical protein
VPLKPDNDLEGKKSEDAGPYKSTNHLGYSSNNQQYQPERQPSSQGHGTYPPQRDPYSTGYYQEYGDGHDGREGTAGDLGVEAGAGTFAGIGAEAAVAAAALGGYGQYPVQPLYEQQRQPYSQQQGQDPCESTDKSIQRQLPKALTLPVSFGFAFTDANSSAYAYAQPEPQTQPMPMPVPAARVLSPQSQFTNTTVNRVDPYTNPGYMHDRVPYPSHNPHHETQSDAYGGYETPNTARPMDNPAGYGQSYSQSQMNEGTPQFPPSGELPTYALAADTTWQGQGQPARLTGLNDKSRGHFT